MSSNSTTSIDLGADSSMSVIRAAESSIVLCLIFYIARIASRLLSGTRLMASDYVLFGGVIACVVISSIDIWVVRLGLGKHIQVVAETDPSLSNVKTTLKFLMVNDCFHAFGQVTVKVLGAFTIAWGIAFEGVSIFPCNPIYAFWEFEIQPVSYCINNQAFYVAMAVPNILADITIVCIPVYQVWKLQLDRRSKVELSFIFLLGGFVCVASVIRVVTLFQIDNQDPTYTLVGIANWSSLEFALAVVGASLPTLRPLIKKIASTLGYSNNATSRQSGPRNPTIGSAPPKLRRPQPHRDAFYKMNDGTETFASHYTADDIELLGAGGKEKTGIMVTNTFSANISR